MIYQTHYKTPTATGDIYTTDRGTGWNQALTRAGRGKDWQRITVMQTPTGHASLNDVTRLPNAVLYIRDNVMFVDVEHLPVSICDNN